MTVESLSGNKRDTRIKAKKLLRSGIIPAVVYGKSTDTMSLQFEASDVHHLLHNNAVGSQVTLMIDGQKIPVIIKEISRAVMNSDVKHMDFQALTKGEKIKLRIPITISGKEGLPSDALANELLSEIEIQTIPQYLVDHIIVDISKLQIGDSIKIADLPISRDEHIDVLTDGSHTVLTIINRNHAAKSSEEPEEVEEINLYTTTQE